MSTADAVDREAAWLASFGDGLPALLAAAGGPFDVVQAYLRRTPQGRTKQLYVTRRHLREERFAHPRRMPRYQFELRIIWPMSSNSGAAEDSQRALDEAVDLVLQRVGGFVGDKSHGGRFLSAAENPPEVTVSFSDPERSMDARADLEATVSYWADDTEITG
ncbi:hypothetical protein [Streptomyces violascens]|uniref:hypothetical protein n=1 Tax=Streptomyces violascens TaxID=67381 RepID=UPI0036C4E5E4